MAVEETGLETSVLRAVMSSEVEEYEYLRSKEQILKGASPVGFVTSPTSTKKCDFAVFDYATDYVYEGQLLTVSHQKTKAVGLVSNLFAATRGATTDVLNLSSSLYGEVPRLDQNMKFGELRIYGIPAHPGVRRLSHPPKPCSPIFISNKEDYEALFRDPAREGEYYSVGKIRETDYPVDLDASAILRLGVGIFARIGMGKSVTTAANIVGLSSLKKKVNVIVWDHTGEYATSNLDKLCSNFQVMSSLELPVVPTDANDIVKTLGLDVLPSQAKKAVEVAADIFVMDFTCGAAELNSECFMSYVNEWLDEFYKKDGSISSWSAAIRRRVKLLGKDIFAGGSVDQYNTIWKRAAGKILVIDASCDTLDARQAKIGTIADLILRNRYPIHLVIDEAKNYIPEMGGSYGQITVGKPYLSSGKITSLSEEGRKFGANLTIINQRISRISKTVFSNLSTLFCGCLTAANDMRAIEDYTDFPEIQKILPRLGVGEFLIAGMATPLKDPLCVTIEKGDIQLGYGGNTVFDLHRDFAERSRV
ncbi:MAG: ATP-binding protein [Candidatus Freyarchaeota archaeon]|nr:ATP-binding protein [Candidatus Jordarchaeia archaeon]